MRRHHITNFKGIGWNIHPFAIHAYVAVAGHLARSSHSGRKACSKERVIEAQFQSLQEVGTGISFTYCCLLYIATKLFFANAVVKSELLFLAQTDGEIGKLSPSCGSMLSGWIRAS